MFCFHISFNFLLQHIKFLYTRIFLGHYNTKRHYASQLNAFSQPLAILMHILGGNWLKTLTLLSCQFVDKIWHYSTRYFRSTIHKNTSNSSFVLKKQYPDGLTCSVSFRFPGVFTLHTTTGYFFQTSYRAMLTCISNVVCACYQSSICLVLISW